VTGTPAPDAPVILITVTRQPSPAAEFIGTFAKAFFGTLAVIAVAAVLAISGIVAWFMSQPLPH